MTGGAVQKSLVREGGVDSTGWWNNAVELSKALFGKGSLGIAWITDLFAGSSGVGVAERIEITTINRWTAADVLFVPGQGGAWYENHVVRLAVLVLDGLELERDVDAWSADERLGISVGFSLRKATESVRLNLLGVGKDDFLGPFKLGLETREEGPMLEIESLVLEGAVQAVGALVMRSRDVLKGNLGSNNLLEVCGQVTLDLNKRVNGGLFAAKVDEVT